MYHPRVTTDRVAGGALALLALVVVEECWRGRLPFGTLAVPRAGLRARSSLAAVTASPPAILIVALRPRGAGRSAPPAGASGATRVAIVATLRVRRAGHGAARLSHYHLHDRPRLPARW